jgi:hypothetical protein
VTLYRHGRSARVDPRPRVSGSEFEAVVDIHAAPRIVYEPAVRMSLRSVREQAETYLASLVVADKSSTIEDDKNDESKKGIIRLSHA